MEKYPQLHLIKHDSDHSSLSVHYENRSRRSMDNLTALDKVKGEQENPEELRDYHEQLHDLLDVQVQALNNLCQLQFSWMNNVEKDRAVMDELKTFHNKHKEYADFCHSHHETQVSD